MENPPRPYVAAGIIAMRPGLTFQELGRIVGAHPDVVSRVVRGIQPGSQRLKDAIAFALDLPVDVLFERREAVTT
ncbi:helix-turn-helix transcriptional regulator [Aeromicrobium fastidiosum]|uniref:helix-turn-helix domain-containing protein n=1 Tax=Aeromicrobium fastidiosum TaxID=52699 RepID=UPI002023330D|nr:helix-turn-helix transcriptional regulator [Aeromicrobium fastidiosum]MCL8251373.1 helix-turn-helix transcriptional regulator [Aeromicrobium fastidiosum]